MNRVQRGKYAEISGVVGTLLDEADSEGRGTYYVDKRRAQKRMSGRKAVRASTAKKLVGTD